MLFYVHPCIDFVSDFSFLVAGGPPVPKHCVH